MRNVINASIVVLAGLAALVPLPATFVESFYSRGIYLSLQCVLTPLTNSIPIALLDVAGLVVGICLASIAVVRLVMARRRRLGAVLRLAWQGLIIAGAGYLVFMAMWGLNYEREPLTAKLEFDGRRITRQALVDVAGRSVDRLNALRPSAVRWPPLDGIVADLGPAFAQTQRRFQPRTAVPGEPKWSLLTLFFERAAVDGMTDPFFLEVLVRHDLLPFERPFVVAHEWAHLAGYADESEANFVGWLTCLAGNEAAKYSGWLFLYGQVAGSLGDADRRRVSNRLQPQPRADLQALYEKYQRQTIPLARDASRVVYDRFLKANRVEAGIDSYDAVVRLVLGTTFRGESEPVLRSQ